jgi:hypothetical protein
MATSIFYLNKCDKITENTIGGTSVTGGEKKQCIQPLNLLKLTGYVMHQKRYLYVLQLSENKQRLVPLTA